MSIALIAGLGNPGPEYRHTRHNVGYLAVEAFARKLGLTWSKEDRFLGNFSKTTTDGRPLWLALPLTYMNDSGRCLGPFCRYYHLPPESVVAVYDDITLPLGRMKLSLRGSAGGHNGVDSLLEHLGDSFVRLRIGIGGKAHPAMDLKDHVLGRFLPEEQAVIQSKMPDILQTLQHLVDKGPVPVMNLINQRKS